MNGTTSTLCIALLGTLAGGCLSIAEPPPPQRYFAPPPVDTPADSAVDSPGDSPGANRVVLVLLPVDSAASVQDRFMWRLSDVERAYDDLHHWADHPRAFINAGLRTVLFAGGAFKEVGEGATEGWEVEASLEAFEVARSGSEGTAEVVLRLRVRGGEVRRHTIRAIASGEGVTPEALARTMGRAIAQACTEAAKWLGDLPPRPASR